MMKTGLRLISLFFTLLFIPVTFAQEIRGSFHGIVDYSYVTKGGVTPIYGSTTPPGLRNGDLVIGRFSYDTDEATDAHPHEPTISNFSFSPVRPKNYLMLKGLGRVWESGADLHAQVENNHYYAGTTSPASDYYMYFWDYDSSVFPYKTHYSAQAGFRIGNVFQPTPNNLVKSDQLPTSENDIDISEANTVELYITSASFGSTQDLENRWGIGATIDMDSFVLSPKSECKASLPFDWPSPTSAARITQDYAELSTEKSKHYHTGFDIGATVSGTPDPVYAAAEGKVVFADNLKSLGFQNVVILEHKLQDETVYTLYGHLLEIDPSIKQSLGSGMCIDRGTRLGKTGGERKYAHLHFEIKTSAIPDNPVKLPDTCTKKKGKKLVDTCYGYTLTHPTNVGYLDPDNYLNILDDSDFPSLVLVTDSVNARSGPGSLNGGKYPVYGKATSREYVALAKGYREILSGCDGQWYKIRRSDNDCLINGHCFSKNTFKTEESIPDAWVCGDYITPIIGPLPSLTPSPH